MSSNVDVTTWKKQSGFIWSLIGSAVGFANVLSFSAQCYKNGGGAFLIPYIIALLVLGIPLLILEGFIGYRWKLPLVPSYGKVWKGPGRALGWIAVLACVTIGAFYIVLTGYSVAYIYFTATSSIPEDTASFFKNDFLQATPSIGDFGRFSIGAFIATLTVAIFSWFVLVKNIRDGLERICTLFMPLLAVFMAVFAIVVLFLPGASDGWIWYLKPDFSKLLEPRLWRDVFGQLLFSLSLGLGIVVGYSRHTQDNTNIPQSMVLVAIGDFLVSFVCGFAIFGCIAHMSFTSNIPMNQIISSDSSFEIGFVIFPQILKAFGPYLSPIIGSLFFFCVFIAGITGVFSIVESIAGNIETEFHRTRKVAVSWTIAILVLLSTFFCMGNSSHIIDALAPMVMGNNMLLGSIMLCFAFMYHTKKRSENIFLSQRKKGFSYYSLKYVLPYFLSVILVANVISEFQDFTIGSIIQLLWIAIAIVAASMLARKTRND